MANRRQGKQGTSPGKGTNAAGIYYRRENGELVRIHDEVRDRSRSVYEASLFLDLMGESIEALTEAHEDGNVSDYHLRLLYGLEQMAEDLSERLTQVAEDLQCPWVLSTGPDSGIQDLSAQRPAPA